MLCLLCHTRLEERITDLVAEGHRLNSLPLADPGQQQRALLAVEHRMNAVLDGFYRPRRLPEATG